MQSGHFTKVIIDDEPCFFQVIYFAIGEEPELGFWQWLLPQEQVFTDLQVNEASVYNLLDQISRSKPRASGTNTNAGDGTIVTEEAYFGIFTGDSITNSTADSITGFPIDSEANNSEVDTGVSPTEAATNPAVVSNPGGDIPDATVSAVSGNREGTDIAGGAANNVSANIPGSIHRVSESIDHDVVRRIDLDIHQAPGIAIVDILGRRLQHPPTASQQPVTSSLESVTSLNQPDAEPQRSSIPEGASEAESVTVLTDDGFVTAISAGKLIYNITAKTPLLVSRQYHLKSFYRVSSATVLLASEIISSIIPARVQFAELSKISLSISF